MLETPEVPAVKFANLSCDQLKQFVTEQQVALDPIVRRQQRRATTDAIAGVGFGIAGLAVTNTLDAGGNKAAQITSMRGDIAAARKQAEMQPCQDMPPFTATERQHADGKPPEYDPMQ